MNTDKAYILGLAIGGGCFNSDNSSFYIRLPYRQWGEIEKNPQRAGIIANDILHVVKPLMRVEYDLDVSYETGREWRILCSGSLNKLIEDLGHYSIEPTSELHKTADISQLVLAFTDVNMKKRFIAGVADTIGSMAPSQRRFSADVQIISFEISGFNYKFVCQMCNLLYDVGCVPDQILWQHPNMQSGTDAYYTSWKKGNKLRVTLDSFSTFGSLAFKSKTLSSKENRQRQRDGIYNAATRCEEKPLSVPGVVAVHIDENHPGIPENIRGGHYIHHKQICAALNCPHAPYDGLTRLLAYAEKYISPFAILHKGEAEEVNGIIARDPLFSDRVYTDYTVYISDIIKAVDEGEQVVLFSNGSLRFSNSRKKGYPLNVLLDGLAYIVASKTGNLNGKRPKGNRNEILMNAITENPTFSVKIRVPDMLTPIIVTDDVVSAMISPYNEDVYKQLISYDDNNPYKMIVRRINEEDLR